MPLSVGQAILPAAAFPGGFFGHLRVIAPRRSRLKAGSGDWPVPSSKSARGPSIVKLRLRAGRKTQEPRRDGEVWMYAWKNSGFGSNLYYTAEGANGRSEEHTSELQSLRHLVCRLLLHKDLLSARPLVSLAPSERAVGQRPCVRRN